MPRGRYKDTSADGVKRALDVMRQANFTLMPEGPAG
jgi:hypothetical protein